MHEDLNVLSWSNLFLGWCVASWVIELRLNGLKAIWLVNVNGLNWSRSGWSEWSSMCGLKINCTCAHSVCVPQSSDWVMHMHVIMICTRLDRECDGQTAIATDSLTVWVTQTRDCLRRSIARAGSVLCFLCLTFFCIIASKRHFCFSFVYSLVLSTSNRG